MIHLATRERVQAVHAGQRDNLRGDKIAIGESRNVFAEALGGTAQKELHAIAYRLHVEGAPGDVRRQVSTDSAKELRATRSSADFGARMLRT